MPNHWKSFITVLLAAACLLPAAAAAGVTPPRSCPSADLRFPFMPGGPNGFGVFRLRVTDGSCALAHRVAKAWKTSYETANRSPGPLRLPHSVAGFTFRTVPARLSQTFRELGVRGRTTIGFDYRIPNG